jgi:hypothetical protein
MTDVTITLPVEKVRTLINSLQGVCMMAYDCAVDADDKQFVANVDNFVRDLSIKIRQKIVLADCVCNGDEDIAKIVNAFKEEGMDIVYIDQFLTMPGQGGEGGRSDLMFAMSPECVLKAAVHSFHLQGLFVWADDYYANCSEIVPHEKRVLFA